MEATTNNDSTYNHCILIVDENGTNWICYDVEKSTSSWSTISKSDLTTKQLGNNWNHSATVNESCLAKICPTLMSLTDAISYTCISNEYIFVEGTCTGNVSLESNRTIKGRGSNPTIVGDVDLSNESNILLDGVTVDGTVYFNSATNSTIDNSTVEDPISISSSSGIKIYRTDADFTSGNAIDMSGSSADIWDFETSSVYRGVYPHNSSDADISYSDITSSSYGLYIDGSSSAYLDEISFCSNTNYDIYLASGGNIEIEENSNSFSDDPEYSTYGVSSSDLPEYYDVCGSLLKSTFTNIAQNSLPVSISSDLQNAFNTGLHKRHEIKKRLREDYLSDKTVDAKTYQEDYETAISAFKNVADIDAGSNLSLHAIRQTVHCYWELDEPESVKTYIESIIEDKRFSEIADNVQSLMISYYLHKDDCQTALGIANDIIESSENKVLICEMLYSKGKIYRHYLDDKNKATEIFRKIVSEYPDNPTASSADFELAKMGEKIPAHSEEAGDELTSSVYPNPFNPSTNITFTLPEAGRVHIEIFDVLGRKVITLVDEYHQQGSFTVLWNGQNKYGYTVASGIFFCVIAYNDQVITKKMVMMR